MPWLYHVYAGHDNNRDWYMFNLPETRAVTKVLYHDWLPQIHVDEHQQGSNGARLFVPPFMDPPLPNIQPSVWRGGQPRRHGHELRPPEERDERRRQRPLLHGLVDRRLRRHLLAPQRHRHPQRGGLGAGGQPHLHRAERAPDGLPREADGLRRSLARRLVAPARPRRLRARPVEEHDQDGRPPQGGPALQLLPDVQELRREGRQGPALRLRHPGRAAGLSDHAQDARGPEDGRRRDPPGQGRFHRRRPLLQRRLVRGQDGPALQDLRLGPARKAEIPGYAAVSRRPAGPALRQRRLDPAPADGRPLRRGRGGLRGQAREDRRGPLSQGPGPGEGRLLRPRRPGQRLLRHGLRPAQGRGRGLADQGRRPRSRATTSRPGASSSRTRPR